MSSAEWMRARTGKHVLVNCICMCRHCGHAAGSHVTRATYVGACRYCACQDHEGCLNRAYPVLTQGARK